MLPNGKPEKDSFMKAYGNTDLGVIFDDIFQAAQDFSNQFQQNFRNFDPLGKNGCGDKKPEFNFSDARNSNADYYPAYSYPPTNVYVTNDKKLVFEFAVAGFAETDLSLRFQGDYMYLSANISSENITNDNISYLKHRLKLKDIESQKYFVPESKFDQAAAQAVYKNGILRVFIPPKEEPIIDDGIKVEIVNGGA